jgi:hypothetical protein
LQSQSTLIFSTGLKLATLSSITDQIAGFFIVENHVLNSTRGFRSERDIDDLWDGVVARLAEAVNDSLQAETDPDVFLATKEHLLSFITTLEVGHNFPPQAWR